MTTVDQQKGQTPNISPPSFLKPEMPPPPYFKTQFINPSSFKVAINTKLDKPLISLYRLSIRLLQAAFALASGISYAIELSSSSSKSQTNLIYAEVVFGFTLITLVIDTLTIRYYRLIWVFEWLLAVLWYICFAVFFQAFLGSEVKDLNDSVNVGRVQRATWCNLVNALLWTISAMFSCVMCCTGARAAIKKKLEIRR